MSTAFEAVPIMMSHPSLPRFERPAGDARPRIAPVARDAWVAACAHRLCSLRPRARWAACLALAQDLWPEVGGYDPEIAAELEHESNFDDA